MDPKRRKIYILVIILCIAACIAVLWWGGLIGGGDSVDEAPLAVPAKTVPKQTADGSYQAPTVFPNNPKLDTSVFDLSLFKSLKAYSSPDLPQTELGREDPFKSY